MGVTPRARLSRSGGLEWLPPSSASSAQQPRWRRATTVDSASTEGLRGAAGAFCGSCPAPEKHRTASQDVATKGKKGTCRPQGLLPGEMGAPRALPRPPPAPALAQLLWGALSRFLVFWTFRLDPPNLPFLHPALRRLSRWGLGISIPGPRTGDPPRDLPTRHRVWFRPSPLHQTPLVQSPAAPEPDSPAGATRTSRAPEVASAQLPARRAGGGASYGDTVQSECNTRGFGGAGAAPPLACGFRPAATFDEGSRGVRALLGQSGAAEPRPPKVAAIPDPRKVWEKAASHKSRERKFCSESQ